MHRLETDRIESTATFELESSASQPIEFTLPEQPTITTVKMNGIPYPYQPNQALKLLTNIGIDRVTIAWKRPMRDGPFHPTSARYQSADIQPNNRS